jgi:hypothetical protein
MKDQDTSSIVQGGGKRRGFTAAGTFISAQAPKFKDAPICG